MNGMYFTKNKLVNFCSLIPASKAFNQVFTYVDSPIKTLKDLDGKRVALGARASPTSVVNEEIFKVLGIKTNYVYSTPGEATDMVKDHRVDAMAYGVGAPWSTICASSGIIVGCIAITGSSYFWDIRWNMYQRILFFMAAIGLVYPDIRFDIAGFLMLAAGFFSHPTAWRKLLGR